MDNAQFTFKDTYFQLLFDSLCKYGSPEVSLALTKHTLQDTLAIITGFSN